MSKIALVSAQSRIINCLARAEGEVSADFREILSQIYLFENNLWWHLNKIEINLKGTCARALGSNQRKGNARHN